MIPRVRWSIHTQGASRGEPDRERPLGCYFQRRSLQAWLAGQLRTHDRSDHGWLPILLRWLTEANADMVCLKELKASTDKFQKAAAVRRPRCDLAGSNELECEIACNVGPVRGGYRFEG